MADKQRDCPYRMKIFPGQSGAGFFEVENDRQGQARMVEAFAAIGGFCQPAGPRLACRSMVIDLDDRRGNAGHRFKLRGRKRKIEDVDHVAGNFSHFPRLTVMHGAIGGLVAKT